MKPSEFIKSDSIPFDNWSEYMLETFDKRFISKEQVEKIIDENLDVSNWKCEDSKPFKTWIENMREDIKQKLKEIK